MNKKLVKLITLILSCLLLIGAAVGIAVAADEPAAGENTTEAKIAIAKKNIAYEGKIQILYLVQAPAGTLKEDVKVVFTSDGSASVANNAIDLGTDGYVKTAAGTFTLGGVEYFTVYSNGYEPKALRQDVVALPVLAEGEGESKTLTAGEADTFSPYTYAMTRFNSGKISANQRTLYKAMLDYGAAVQELLGYDGDAWIDEYYFLTLDGNEQALRGRTFDGVVTADRFIEDGTKGFTGWTDGEGNAVVGWTTMTINPGTTVINKNYAENRNDLITFDGLAELPGNATFTQQSGKDSFATVADDVVSFGHLQSISDSSSVKFAPTTPGVYAREYVFETDFNWKAVTQTKNQWVYKLCIYRTGAELFNITLNPKTVGFEAGGVMCDYDTWHHLKLTVKVLDDGSLATVANVDGKETLGVNVQYFDKNAITNDYKMVSAGVGMRDSSYHDCTDTYLLLDNVAVYTVGEAVSYELSLDVNGGDALDPFTVTMGEEYTLPTPTKGDTPFSGWYLGDTRVEQTGTWTYVGYDSEAEVYGKAPTLTAKWATPINVTLDPNGGEVSSNNVTVYAGSAYTLPTPERAGLIFGGWYDADGNMYGDKGAEWKGTEDVALTAKWFVEIAGVTNDFTSGKVGVGSTGTVANGVLTYNATGWDTNAYFSVKSNNSQVSGNEVGNKYVFEADFTYLGGATAEDNPGSSTAPAFIGFNNKGYSSSNTGMYYSDYIYTSKATDSDGKAASVTIFGQKHEKDVTYRIRYEVVVGEDTVVHVYVDGEYKGTHKLILPNGKNQGADPKSVYGFQFGFRKPANFELDNTYCGIIAPAAESKVTLDANGGSLPEGTELNFSAVVGGDYTLPTPSISGYTFGGWYNGTTKVADSGKWGIANDVTLTAQWLDAKTSTMADQVVDKSGWSTTKFYNSNVFKDDGIGTVYVFSTDYTYRGLTGFTVDTDGIITVNAVGTANYGFPRLYGYLANSTTGTIFLDGTVMPANTAKYVNSDGTVVAENGVLLDAYKSLAATDIYYSQIAWWGFTFDMNKTYKVVITITLTESNPEIVIAVTDEDGNTTEKAMTATQSIVGLSHIHFETRGTGTSNGYPTSYKLGQTYANNSLVVKKPMEGTFTTQNDYADATGNRKDPNIVKPGYDENEVDEAGSKFIIDTNYKFEGLGGVFTIDPETYEVTSCYVSNAVIAYMGFYNNKSIGDRLKYADCKLASGAEIVNADGVKVVDENNVLLEEYRDLTADDLFYSKVTWGGITFVVGETYKLHLAYTSGSVSYENGIVTAAVGSVVFTATDSEGNVQNGSISAGASGDCDYYHNVQGFSFYCRANKEITGSNDIAYTFYHSFTDIEVVTFVPDEQIVTNGVLYGAKLFHKNPDGSSVISVDSGSAYTLPTLTYDGYTFVGWYECDAKGNITGTEAVPSTGEFWPLAKNIKLAAKWEAVAAE